MQITRPQFSTPSASKPPRFAGKLSEDETRLAELRQELTQMDAKMARYERRGEKAGNAAGVVGAGATVATGTAAGLAVDGAATLLTGGASLLVAPAVAGAGGFAASSQAAEGVGDSFKKGMKKFVIGWGKFFNEDEHNALKSSVSSLSSKISSANSTLQTLKDLEAKAQKAKYASELTSAHRQAYQEARDSGYEELNERHRALGSVLCSVPNLSWALGGKGGVAYGKAKQDLTSNDIRTQALALRRFYQAERGEHNSLDESPAIYQKHLLSPEERIVAASLRAMIEESELRPGHYNQVLASALVSGKPKLQKAALLGLKEQLKPNGTRQPFYFRSILVDQALQDIVQGQNVSGKSKEKLQALAEEVLELRNENRKMPDKTVVEEAAEMIARPFAGNPRLKANTETYLSIFQQAMGAQKEGTNLMLFSAGTGGIGKTQYAHNVANESLGPDSLLPIDLASLRSQQSFRNALIKGATGYRDGKYRLDGRTIFFDEFQQVGDNPNKTHLIPLLKKITGKEEIPNIDLKNTIVVMTSNDEPEDIKGLKDSSDGKTLISRLDSFPRQVNLSEDIKGDSDGFVHRYINAKAYKKDFPNLEGVQFFPEATQHFQQQLREEFPAEGSRKLSPRRAIASISQVIEDAMATTPQFREKHTQGSPFIIDKDQETGRLIAVAIEKPSNN